MIYLASSSITRAQILKDNDIDFIQIQLNFDESKIENSNPYTYAYSVTQSKKEQFYKIHKDYDKVLFADSCVVVDGKIFGKAKNDEEAHKMLLCQSENSTSVVTAMLFCSKEKIISNVSIATYIFSKFDPKDLCEYISSKRYQGKAGAMMIEDFNKKYILSQKGNTSTAMGLNVEILKAYL